MFYSIFILNISSVKRDTIIFFYEFCPTGEFFYGVDFVCNRVITDILYDNYIRKKIPTLKGGDKIIFYLIFFRGECTIYSSTDNGYKTPSR